MIMIFILLFFAFFAFASAQSDFASLNQTAGMSGNPAGLGAFGSGGAIVDYNRVDGNTDNFLFGFWGEEYGAAFNWTKGDGGYDKSEWSFINSRQNSSRSAFLGNRVSAVRISEKDGTAFSWTPGLILRPVGFLSLGLEFENLLFYGFHLKRAQSFGLSLRPFNDITVSWNADVKDNGEYKHFFTEAEQKLGLELDAFGWSLGLEFPLVERDEFRMSLSSQFGSYSQAQVAIAMDDDGEMSLKNVRYMYHAKLNLQAIENLHIVRVPLGALVEKSSGWSLFGGDAADLLTLRNHFELLAMSGANAVVLDFSNYSGGLSIAQEIRRGIFKLKSSGKKVLAYSNNFRPVVIYAASAADKIVLQPSAMVDFRGLSGEVQYYKGLLDWAGIKVDMLRHGRYKSAVEQYTADSMSSEAREDSYNLMEGLWGVVRDSVAASRGLSASSLDSFARNPKVTASAAKNAGLADTILYLDDIAYYVSSEMLGRENANAFYEDWYPSDEKLFARDWSPKKKIAVLTLSGTIMGGYGGSDPLFGKNAVGVADVIDVVNEVRYSGEYAALILRIDSPGGSALASDELWHSLITLRDSGVPIVASVGDIAASGGYYAACAADKIVAENNSIVGSIGIFGGKADLSGLLAKLKVRTETVATHPSADAQSFSRGFTESERAALQEYMDDFYKRFLGVVANGRGISEEMADSLGQGRVFTGSMAVENGLIDEIGGFDAAVASAKMLAGLRENAKVELVQVDNFGVSFADKVYGFAKGGLGVPLNSWVNALENTNLWAIY